MSSLIRGFSSGQSYSQRYGTAQDWLTCAGCSKSFSGADPIYSLACRHIVHKRCFKDQLMQGLFQVLAPKETDQPICCPLADCKAPLSFNENMIRMANDMHNDDCQNPQSTCSEICSGERRSSQEQQLVREFKQLYFSNYEAMEWEKNRGHQKCAFRAMTIGWLSICAGVSYYLFVPHRL